MTLGEVLSRTYSSQIDPFLLKWIKISTCFQILCAITHCFSHGLIHRDIKLDNIMIYNRDFRVILCDFGCSMYTSSKTWKSTYYKGMPFGGNLAHLAPEVTALNYLKFMVNLDY